MRIKLSNKFAIGSTIAGLVSAMLLSFGGVAQADCYQYNPNGFVTSSTPVFNNICGVPDGINNESDFVRVRPDVSGSDEDNTNNPTYTVGTLNASCQSGDKFDVYNYLHNDATSDDNDNGSGSAVAHDVMTHMTAPLGSNSNSFTFGDTVTASNAASVSDTAVINCGSNDYTLSLVPGTVHIYSIPYGGWQNLDDSSVNSAVKLGSPTLGSGDMWGCWNYRIAIVYQVSIKELPPPPVPQVTATCNLLTVLANSDRTVTVNQFKYTANNASFKNVVVNWGDNSQNSTITNASTVVGTQHTYSSYGKYEISALATFSTANGDVTSGGPNSVCSEMVTFAPNTPPVVTPPTPTPPTTTVSQSAPSELVNTGAGNTIGLFAAVTALAAIAHRFYLGRRLSRQ